jgi:hypothetical protein
METRQEMRSKFELTHLFQPAVKINSRLPKLEDESGVSNGLNGWKGSNETRMEEKKEKGIKSKVGKKSVSETELGDTRTHTKKETH